MCVALSTQKAEKRITSSKSAWVTKWNQGELEHLGNTLSQNKKFYKKSCSVIEYLPGMYMTSQSLFPNTKKKKKMKRKRKKQDQEVKDCFQQGKYLLGED